MLNFTVVSGVVSVVVNIPPVVSVGAGVCVVTSVAAGVWVDTSGEVVGGGEIVVVMD